VTISGGSALAKDDIERMMADAEKYAEEDAKRREEAEVRNRADSLAYTTEKFLAENSDKVPDDIKSEVEAAITDLKKALEGTDTDAIKEASEKAAQVSQKMGTAIYAQAQASAPEGEAGSDAGEASSDDDVVEAEIVDEDPHRSEEGGGA
jgi:molecular chaperone DnaK